MTELEFAPEISAPWSQNMTFLPILDADQFKWKSHLKNHTPIRRPSSFWEAIDAAVKFDLGER